MITTNVNDGTSDTKIVPQVDGGAVIDPVVPVVPAVNIAPELEFDIVDETVTVDPSELTTKLAAQEEELKLMREQASQAKILQDGFSQLGQQFNTMQAPQTPVYPNMPVAPVQAQANFNIPEKTTFNEDFFKDPQSGIANMLMPVMQNQQANYEAKMSSMNKMLSKQTALSNENNRSLFGKYGQEIEAYAANFGGDDPYAMAFSQTRSNHFSELMEANTTTAVDAALAKYKEELAKVTKDPAQSSPVGATTLDNVSAPAKTKVQISAKDMKYVKSIAEQQFGVGVNMEMQMQVYDYLKRNDKI
jgi:hypothetical protein